MTPRESVQSQRVALHHTHRKRPFDHSTRHTLQKQSELAKSKLHCNARDTESESKQGSTWRSSNPRVCESIFLCEKSNDVQASVYARGNLCASD